jgi:hypothetical protein
MAPRRNVFARGQWSGGKGTRSINSIITDYKAFKDVVDTECERIMGRAAEMTLDYIMPYVPRQYGGLQNSARAEAIQTGKGWAARVSFGGLDAPVPPTPNAPRGIVDYAAVINYGIYKPGQSEPLFFLETGTAESKEPVDQYIMTELRKIKP